MRYFDFIPSKQPHKTDQNVNKQDKVKDSSGVPRHNSSNPHCLKSYFKKNIQLSYDLLHRYWRTEHNASRFRVSHHWCSVGTRVRV